MGWLNSLSCGLIHPKQPQQQPDHTPSPPDHKQRETAPSPSPEPTNATPPPAAPPTGDGEPLSTSPTSSLLHQDSLTSDNNTNNVPQVSSPKQLSRSSLPSISTPSPNPTSPRIAPQIQRLHQESGHSISLEPPTPIDAPVQVDRDRRFILGDLPVSSPSPSQGGSKSGANGDDGSSDPGNKVEKVEADLSQASSFFFPSSATTSSPPPLQHSPEPSSTLSPILPSSPSSLTPTSSIPPSPTPSLRADLSPSSPHGFTHRRSGSGDSTRRFRETLNAFTVRGEEGRGSRRVNQYLMGGKPARIAREKMKKSAAGAEGEGQDAEVAVEEEGEGEEVSGEDGEDEGEILGKGSYASVIKCRDTSVDPPVEYAAKSFSKSRIRARLKTSSMRQNRGRGRGGRGRGGGEVAPSTRMWEEPTLGDLDSQGPVNLSLVQSEVAIMKKLNHPNVAYIHEVIDVTDDDELLIIMELCAGGPISKVSMETKGEKMEEEQARDVFRQLILGVAYLHHNDIIHRDIKPDNCLFMADGVTVKLVDFGVSEMFVKKQDDKVRKSAGSPMYMAPELIELDSERLKEGIHGQATDIWSLGVTLYILVTGELPFQVDSIADLYDAIVKTEIHIPPSLPKSLQSLLSHLLSKNPDHRITMNQLWTDSWLTNDGTDPLPTYEENCATPIAAPTRDELETALMGFRTKAQVARAANKFRTLGRRSVSEGSGVSGVSAGTPNSSNVNVATGKESVKEEEGDRTSPPSGGGLLSPERKDTGSSFNTFETNATSLPTTTTSGSSANSASGHGKDTSDEKAKDISEEKEKE